MYEDRPEMWAGFECTVNRVGGVFYDQISRTGHDRRPDDLERLVALGVRTIRYPILWERHERILGGEIDWRQTDSRLGRMRELGLRPIAGLVHHGSGPPGTSLVEHEFAAGLERFAGRVAERYPWIESFTPINEPLTTARFAGLYGHWYPHGRDPRTFARALLMECRATVLAMAAIRREIPRAQLIQTDDLGQTNSSPDLEYQADFENERRWFTWDLLAGRFDRRHPLADYLLHAGIHEAEIFWFLDNPCYPDVIGINHYVTSNRYLDHRVERYPLELHGGNSRDAYVDIDAVRRGISCGVGPLLQQAWERYRIPVAITEAHLGCTREEQLRWLNEVWRDSCDARRREIDVRAVTAWSAFGAYDWDSLVTLNQGHYEPGLFDARWNPPKPTALATLVREIASGAEPDHPALDAPGWWHRPERFIFGAAESTAVTGTATDSCRRSRLLLITGATGTLGRAFARICQWRGLPNVLLSRAELDIADPASVAAALQIHRPWAVINAAGYTRIEGAETEPHRCLRENAAGPALLAGECAARKIALVTFSSDFVFDGRQDRPYREKDLVGPLNVYGTSKAEAERAVLIRHPEALVIRTSAFFGPWDERNFVARALAALRGGNLFAAPDDLTLTPSYVPDLVDATLDLLIDREGGIWHLTNPDPFTWADFAREVACRGGLNARSVIGQPAADFGLLAPRPAFSALTSDRGPLLPPLANALDRFFRDIELRI